VAVAERENLRQAANHLNIAPPPLSVHMRKLEQEIGTDLFIREKRSLRLTDAGRVFLDQARHLLAEAGRGLALTRQAAHGEIGELAVGHNTPSAFRVFPVVLPAVRNRWPDIQLTFHSANNLQLFERMSRGELDLGFGWAPVPGDEFDAEPLLDEPLVALVPADHELAKADTVSIRDLSREPLILSYRSLDPDAYHEIEKLFLNAGTVMNPICQLDNSISMINFVAMGLGCSLLPAYAQSIHQEGVVYKRLEPPTFVRTLAVIKRKGAGRLAEQLFDFTVSHFRSAAPSPVTT
jgi:DNA-binding transcriptional LysR family regulator